MENGYIEEDLVTAWMEKVKEKKEAEKLQLKKEKLLQKAESGDPKAMYEAGLGYHTGCHHGLEQDDKLAFSWYKKGHYAGNVKCTALYGAYLCAGDGVEKSKQNGIMYVILAAERGSDYAAYQLGQALAKGWYGLKVNQADAIYWLKKSLSNECTYKR